MNTKNEGIMISGGKLVADQLTIGKNASATKIVVTDPSENDEMKIEILNLLEEIKYKVEKNETAIDSLKDSIETIEMIESELEKESPNTMLVDAVLESLEKNLGSVVGVVQHISKIKNIFAIMF